MEISLDLAMVVSRKSTHLSFILRCSLQLVTKHVPLNISDAVILEIARPTNEVYTLLGRWTLTIAVAAYTVIHQQIASNKGGENQLGTSPLDYGERLRQGLARYAGGVGGAELSLSLPI